MRWIVDPDRKEIIQEDGALRKEIPYFSEEAFALLSRLWIEVGWARKYSYSFSWLGRPVIQLPEDLIRIQETIYRLRPDVIVETGVAHGGSLIYYASLCRAMDHGRVIGIDINIKPDNRRAIETHSLSGYITLIEGDSASMDVLQQVRQDLHVGDKVLVILDSCHTRDHVLKELRAFAPLVSVGSYLVATDGIMAELGRSPGGKPDWSWDNPQEAARIFAKECSHFSLEDPALDFNEGLVSQRVTYWPSAYLKRVA